MIPNDVDALNNKGNALVKLGKYSEATLSYEKAIRILKSNSSALGYYHTVSALEPHYSLGNEDPIQNIQVLGPQQTNPLSKVIAIQINAANSIFAHRQDEEALNVYQGVHAEDPNNRCALSGITDTQIAYAEYKSGGKGSGRPVL